MMEDGKTVRASAWRGRGAEGGTTNTMIYFTISLVGMRGYVYPTGVHGAY